MNFANRWKFCTRLVIPSNPLENKSGNALDSSISNIFDDCNFIFSAINLSDNQITPNHPAERALFKFLNEAQANNLTESHPHFTSSAELPNLDDSEGEMNRLV